MSTLGYMGGECDNKEGYHIRSQGFPDIREGVTFDGGQGVLACELNHCCGIEHVWGELAVELQMNSLSSRNRWFEGQDFKRVTDDCRGLCGLKS